MADASTNVRYRIYINCISMSIYHITEIAPSQSLLYGGSMFYMEGVCRC